ncbi:MAG: hypothetical protein WC826_00435 [Microgenomates group bacterium]|jgi:hypothetical protein
MHIHKKVKAHIKHHLEKRHKHHMDTSSKIKKPIVFVPLLVLIIIILVAAFLYFKKTPFQLISSNTIDLTTGKVTDLKDNLGPYIEQAPEVCNQDNLSAYFKSFTVSIEAGKPTKSGAPSVYGETTWNYLLQGEISNIEANNSGIKYTLVSGENKLITQSLNNTVSFIKDIASSSGELTPKVVNASTFAIKDKVFLYYLVKCGGNKPPLLFLEYIQKAAIASQQPSTVATSSGGLRTRSNNWQGFRGTVKEKGINFLVLIGGGQTMKVEIGNNIHLRVIDEAESLKNPDLYSKQPPQETSISAVKIGETVDATGVIDGVIFKAMSVLIIR